MRLTLCTVSPYTYAKRRHDLKYRASNLAVRPGIRKPGEDVARRTAAGRSRREIIGSLKRYVSRKLYRCLPRVNQPA